MTTRDPRARRWTRFRWILFGFGAFLCFLGLAADVIGLSSSPGLGTLQLLMIASGGMLVLLGWLGRRIAAAYRGTALVALNTAVLLVLVNAGAWFLLRWPLRASEGAADRPTVADRYGNEPWAETYVADYQRVHHRKQYHPFVVWRTVPFRSETINVDEHGIRHTEGVRCTPDAYLVYAFGGSTMWGVGGPDWGTIPSYLAARLEERLGEPACVINFGEHGWVSTQGVVQLMRELDAGRVPDLVVFYDGINDAYTSALVGRAGVHYQLPDIAARFDGGPDPAIALLRRTSLYRLMARKGPAEGEDLVIELPDSLAGAVVDVYLNNYRLVDALAREFGFAFHFFWQPNLITGAKAMTSTEAKIASGMDEESRAYLRTVYALVREATPERPHLSYIADAFENTAESVYIDWMHITPAGNRIVADTMIAIVGREGVLPAPDRRGEDR